ncbi:endospore germination permease [Paenibacillus sp. GCM10012307]|uniref:Endospore germination permease n=1 Tax=Paenibacillus roseus TaxID=2798579 RepID=A0A934J308_9BACL|nr:endospore germination permease [Paenibacillus roseus]MBJ6360543.1 endospore germination permease [Paenibacillus roseus]
MLEKGRINVRQLAALCLLTQIGDMILVYPAVITSYSHQDSWIASLMGIPFGLFSIWIMLRLYKMQPGKTLIEGLIANLGKWLGAIVSLWYLFYFLILASTITREVGDFLTTQIMPKTPLPVIHLLYLIVVVWAISHGIESMARSAELFLPLVVLFVLFLFVFILPQADINRIRPIFGTGPTAILQGIAVTIAYPFGELIALMMLLPYTTDQRNRNKDILLTALIVSLMLSTLVMISIMVLGPFFTRHNIYASFILAQRISIGNFLERIEVIVATVWILSTFFKGALYFYCFILGISQVLRLRSYKPLIWPSAMIVFGLAMIISPNITYYFATVIFYWVDWDITCGTVIPLFLLLVYHFRNKWSGNRLQRANSGS